MSTAAQRRAIESGSARSHLTDVTAEKDLNDPKVQSDILNPEPREVELSFTKMKIYPMTAKQQRKFQGYATTVMASTIQNRRITAGDGESNGLVSTLYLMGTITGSDKLTSELLSYVSYSVDPPGEATDERAASMYKFLDEQCKGNDLLLLYAVLADISGFSKNLKNDADKTKAAKAKKDQAERVESSPT